MDAERLTTPAASQGSQAKALRQAVQNFKAGDLSAFHETLTVAAIRERQLSVTLTRPQDPDCPLIGCSDAFLSMTGYSRSEVIGQNLRFLNDGCCVAAEDRHRMRIAVRTGKSYSGVLQNRKRNGEVFQNWLSMTALRVGTAVFILGIQVDVTNSSVEAANRAAAEELQAIVDNIFAANVDAWVTNHTTNHTGAKLGHVPYVESMLKSRVGTAQYNKAREAFVSVEHDLLQGHFTYKNTFLEVYDCDDDSFLMGLRHVSSEPALSTQTREELECPRMHEDMGLNDRVDSWSRCVTDPAPPTLPIVPISRLSGGQVSALSSMEALVRRGSPGQEVRPIDSGQAQPSMNAFHEREDAALKGSSSRTGAPSAEDKMFDSTQQQSSQVAPATASVGSSGHPGSCRPCAFHCYSTVACSQGEACLYCHMEHPRKRRQRGRQSRKARRESECAADEEKNGMHKDDDSGTEALGQADKEVVVVERRGVPTPSGLAPLLTALELLSPLPMPEQMLAALKASQPRIAALDAPAGSELGLEYSECSIVLTVGQWKKVVPFVRGDASGTKRFRVYPDLPLGLDIDSRTGVISGNARAITSPDGSVHTVVMTCGASGCAEATVHVLTMMAD
mmetsp:Transcript_52742/g.136188  ORF Transcript_52742/g.136188 Transcript_52742/m.136188 type:complete len:619 (+) Transcript_52742:95-1951(+)